MNREKVEKMSGIGLRRKKEAEQPQDTEEQHKQNNTEEEIDQHLQMQQAIEEQRQQEIDEQKREQQREQYVSPQQRLREKIMRQHMQQKIPMRSFLFIVNDAGDSDKVMVKAEDIMVAIMKFAQTFREECFDWQNMALYVEEVDVVE